MTRIQIHQTRGGLQIESQAAQLRVIRSQRLALSMKQNRTRMDIDRQPMRLEIDQTECFASSGLKTPLRMAGDFYRDALSAGLEAIASIAEEGLRFLRIEQGGNPFREAAMTRGVSLRRMSLRAMPGERPKISFTPERLDIRWTPHSADISWEAAEREAEFIPHQVSVRADPYPSIAISAVTADQEKENP